MHALTSQQCEHSTMVRTAHNSAAEQGKKQARKNACAFQPARMPNSTTGFHPIVWRPSSVIEHQIISSHKMWNIAQQAVKRPAQTASKHAGNWYYAQHIIRHSTLLQQTTQNHLGETGYSAPALVNSEFCCLKLLLRFLHLTSAVSTPPTSHTDSNCRETAISIQRCQLYHSIWRSHLQ